MTMVPLDIINTFKTLSLFKTYMVFLPSKRQASWLPVIPCGHPDCYIGILDDGHWAIEGKSGLYTLDEPQSYFYGVILMEESIEQIKQKLSSFFLSFEICVDAFEIFPFIDIVRAGIEHGSGNWPELALNWYYELPFKNKLQLKDSISNFVFSKQSTQKIRHIYKKELKKLIYHEKNSLLINFYI